ncbi:Protein kinase family protein with leucine-rich repeat domain [Striga hermonthica]|uniref:Protein kinase family protein with leucine-rich repeat domain n=1 Tax=Striga hermonthica TaxID=68872 RepID=A0A9N7RR24_STRHE|nr:Protein kinase family protein with leucine-rich repeat domain [Striga hermonthica]
MSSQIPLLPHLLLLSSLTLPFLGNTQNNNHQEQGVLLSLKSHWGDPPSLTHWTPSSDHCTWPEVRCDPAGRWVTGLSIINASITNTLPPSICHIINLTHLELQWNYIPGPFPTALNNCSNLHHLDLSQNYLVGRIPDRLPPRLSYLNLDANNFTGDIPGAIVSLKALVTLHLAGNLFNGSFPPEIGDLPQLQELSLGYNSFTPQPIPSAFANLKKLKKLWMPEANLIGEIPQAIGNMSALESLDLSVNTLRGSIPQGIFLLQNLTELYLYKNELSGPIPQRIESLKLQIIDLSNNTLTGSIPDGFGNLSSLTGLALFFNRLSGKVPVSIGQLPEIVDVGLFSNNLSGELPPDFGRYSPLKTFQVSSNHFSGQLPEHLCANKALIGLIAFENELMGRLPESLGDCSPLEIVRVHDNLLSGRIPGGLWTSSNLTTLMLGRNLFSGQLPDRVGPQLSLVELMNNEFSGPIPNGISSWEGLTVFRASNNELSGTIPRELTALSLATTISLDGNRFSGPLPSDIISWRSLTTLDLSRNQLSGEIPEAFGLLPALNYLDLSQNALFGRIPPEMGLLKLSSLNVSSNRLSGRIPSEYENAAFDRSFLGNPGLCSSVSALRLGNCHASKIEKSKRFSSHFIAITSSLAALAFLVAILYAVYVRRTYRKRNQISSSTWKLTSFQRLNFTETNILSSLTDDNQIGRGGSGQVYRVPINYSPGKYVAVKRIWESVRPNKKFDKEFHAEIRILGTIRHSNIVKLLCCISSEACKLLVYEYMENHSLDRWLHGKRRQRVGPGPTPTPQYSAVLDWPKRLHIAIGVAHGLCYMHHHCSPPIIHRDVKSSNVLLDSMFNAKIADFGLARILVKQGEPNTMSIVAGSFGYMAPEYAQTRRVNEKIDVYGFGVILLELVTGREAHSGDETLSIVDWTWRHVREGRPVEDAIGEDIQGTVYLEEIATVLRLGLMCTSTFPSNRPAMNDVLQILLRCGQRLLSEKTNTGNEHDVDPLLHSSSESGDSVFSSV